MTSTFTKLAFPAVLRRARVSSALFPDDGSAKAVVGPETFGLLWYLHAAGVRVFPRSRRSEKALPGARP